MPLGNQWWSLSGPFADNSDGAITAGTMRNFANAVAYQGNAGDGFTYIPEVDYDSGDMAVIDQAVTLWLNRNSLDSSTYSQSANWIHSEDVSTRSVYTYAVDENMALSLSLIPAEVTLLNVNEGVSITPIYCVTASDAVEPVYTGASRNVYNMDRPVLTPSSGTIQMDLTTTALLSLPLGAQSLRFGLRLVPPTGETIDNGSTFSIDLSAMSILGVARLVSS